ncbi:hypothetical protein M9H77_04765 [Catharanthus roseus]|uniref:Uncharacterized protein n=1 Tax=Catharanthus roseus TaxID=4058 RepID=A0ACC0CF85_CATRO|nr:hypothetical protein M9H77_04765 [Catharanthus roseus]
MSLNQFQGNQNFTSLKTLEIMFCNNFELFPVRGLSAPNLTSITLMHNLKLKSLPEKLHTLLPSLRVLDLQCCLEIECFPEGGLPSSLEKLTISPCQRLWSCRRQLGWHKDLMMLNFGLVQHINCLESLEIDHFPLLHSLPEEGLPASLSNLSIRHWPLLQSLPKNGLPEPLSGLMTAHCPLLKQRLEFEEGDDWPKETLHLIYSKYSILLSISFIKDILATLNNDILNNNSAALYCKLSEVIFHLRTTQAGQEVVSFGGGPRVVDNSDRIRIREAITESFVTSFCDDEHLGLCMTVTLQYASHGGSSFSQSGVDKDN